jgi:hypothetical protein
MNAPTYKEFRMWAYANAYTTETLAPYVQADNPLKAIERILFHLAGTRFDDEPLPYPKLCQLYQETTGLKAKGTTDTTVAERHLAPDEETAWIESQFRTWAPERITMYYQNAALQWRVDLAPKLAKALEKLTTARTDSKRCQCGCRKKVTGRAKYATSACQRRAHRRKMVNAA